MWLGMAIDPGNEPQSLPLRATLRDILNRAETYDGHGLTPKETMALAVAARWLVDLVTRRPIGWTNEERTQLDALLGVTRDGAR